MNPQPAETRILTALLLGPMDSRELSARLSLKTQLTSSRLGYLRECGEIAPQGIYKPADKRWSRRYQLTPKGRMWAEELIS